MMRRLLTQVREHIYAPIMCAVVLVVPIWQLFDRDVPVKYISFVVVPQLIERGGRFDVVVKGIYSSQVDGDVTPHWIDSAGREYTASPNPVGYAKNDTPFTFSSPRVLPLSMELGPAKFFVTIRYYRHSIQHLFPIEVTSPIANFEIITSRQVVTNTEIIPAVVPACREGEDHLTVTYAYHQVRSDKSIDAIVNRFIIRADTTEVVYHASNPLRTNEVTGPLGQDIGSPLRLSCLPPGDYLHRITVINKYSDGKIETTVPPEVKFTVAKNIP